MWHLVQGPHFTDSEPQAQRVAETLFSPCSMKCNSECERALKNTGPYTNVKYFDMVISIYPYVFVYAQLCIPAQKKLPPLNPA